MFSLFDENNEQERLEERIRRFYEEFSYETRKKLLSKNIPNPENVYDVLYPNTRRELLAKNPEIVSSVEESSKTIRESLLAKIISKEIDLEQRHEDFRKSLVSRNEIINTSGDIEKKSQIIRKNALSKNSPTDSNILKDSAGYRRQNESKNNPNISKSVDIDALGEEFRHRNIAKNVPVDRDDLLKFSEEIRNDYKDKNLARNQSLENDIDRISSFFRKDNISRNRSFIAEDEDSVFDKISNEKRRESISRNKESIKKLEDIAESRREGALAKNKPREIDIEFNSLEIRRALLKSNKSSKSDLEEDSIRIRKEALKNNNSTPSDLESSSDRYRKDDLSLNTPKESDLEGGSIEYRKDDLSLNTPKETDLEEGSIEYRKDDLSLNTPKETDLEGDSSEFRSDDLSLNTPKETDLEGDSSEFRKDDLSLNTPKETDLEGDSIQFRKDDLSLNTPKETDLEGDSVGYRKGDLSLNSPIVTDLEGDSIPFRKDDLSLNIPISTNLEGDSVPFRADDLSLNLPVVTDLEGDSIPFRKDDLSLNVPILTDLESDSAPFRRDDLSLNIPISTNLEGDSVPFREDDLARNVPIVTDLEGDSIPFREGDLAHNVPIITDLESDSAPFRADDLANNVENESDLEDDSAPFRDTVLSFNVENESDLLDDSSEYRGDNISNNIDNPSDLAGDSIPFRGNNISNNVVTESNLLMDSDSFRKNNLVLNPPSSTLGISIEGIGTQTFLGVSKVFLQGLLIRNVLLTKNSNSNGFDPENQVLLEDSYDIRTKMVSANKWTPQAVLGSSSLEYGSSNNHYELLLGTREGTGAIAARLTDSFDASKTEFLPPTRRFVKETAYYINTISNNIQFYYGNTVKNPDGSTPYKEITISDKAYSTDRNAPGGVAWKEAKNSETAIYTYSEGLITENIRKYNLQRNTYNLYGLQPGATDAYEALKGFEGDSSFQDLIERTVGYLKGNNTVSFQPTTVNVPSNPEGKYLNSSPEDALRPNGGINPEPGSPESLMAKTVAGNPFEEEEFRAGNKGVKGVINRIKNNRDVSISVNYDAQNTTSFVVGSKDGASKLSKQRYSIANPYAPSGAESMVFYIENYAITSGPKKMVFPPYITSFSLTDSASWNETTFLGRPEPLYTYNNSTREGTLSFFVLTDYAQTVDIGVDYTKDTPQTITHNFSKSHVKEPKSDDTGALNGSSESDVRIRELEEQNKDIIENEEIGAGNDEQAESGEKKKEINESISNLTSDLKDSASSLNPLNTAHPEAPSVSSNSTKNVYDFMTSIPERLPDGTISSKPGDTTKRLDEMKSELMFQPAFFSGDKNDFVRKMEFLTKTTRPGSKPGETGFSFLRAPVCHLHLGTYINNDIIITSVNHDYNDVPWTTDGSGKVQPMWATVSLTFKILGPYKTSSAKGSAGRVLTADDRGGYYSTRTSVSPPTGDEDNSSRHEN